MERNTKGQFTKGSVRTTEEELKRIQGMKDAWKSRNDYIGDIVNEYPKIYNSWRSFMFTDKGKKIGHSEEWSDFRTFYNDVVSTYEQGKVFRRLDISKPFSKENFIWITPEDAKNLPKSTTIYIEFNDEKHTIKEWSKIIGVTESAIKNRYYKHKNDFTVEEILYGHRKKRGAKQVKDITEIDSDKIRAKASKIISSYNAKDIANGFGKSNLTIDWLINNILTKSCVYCGDTYRIGCDRIDNNLGHNKENVVPCCIECNTARNNYFSHEEMKILGQTIKQIKEQRKK